MSSIIYGAPLLIELLPSRLFRYYLIILHSIVLLAMLLPNRLPVWLNGLLLIGIILHAVRIYFVQKNVPHTAAWVWQDMDCWHERATDRTWQMEPDYFLTTWLIIIPLRDSMHRRYRLLIWKDQLGDDYYKALYRRLKFYREQKSQLVAGE